MIPSILVSTLALLSLTVDAAPNGKHKRGNCRPSILPSSTQPANAGSTGGSGGGITQVGTGTYQPGSQGGTISTTGNSSTTSNTGTGTGAGSGSGGGGGGGISFPSGCLVSSPGGYGIGVDYDTDPSALVAGLGANPCVYGRFYELADWNDLANQGASMASLASGTKSILMLSLKTSNTYNYGDDAIQSVAKALNGLNVGQLWLRFGHEMTMNGPEGNYPPDPPSYVALWKKVAGAVDRSKVKMFWCMNPPSLSGQSWDNLASWAKPWYPGDDYVDINGIDAYADNAQTQLQTKMDPAFCTLFGEKPIFLGEVGVFGNADAGTKTGWAKQLLDPGVKSWCKSYIGFAWFEIQKDGVDYTAAGNGILKGVANGQPATS